MTEPDPVTGEPETPVADVPGLAAGAARAASWSAVQAWGGRLLSIIVFAVLAHLLTPTQFGLVSLASALLAVFLMVQDQGLGQAIVQRHRVDDAELSTAFWASLGGGIVLFALTVAVAGPIAAGLGQPELAPVLRALGGGFVLAGLDTTQIALMRRQLRFRELAVRQLGSALFGGALAVAVAVTAPSVWALVVQTLVGSAVAAVLLWTSSGWRPQLHFARRELRGLLPFAGYSSALGAFSFLSTRIDDLLIGSVLGATALGFYSVAYRALQLAADVFVNVINAVALPVFARVQDDLGRVRQVLRASLVALAAIAIPSFGLLAIYADDVLDLGFGSGWHRSVPVLRVLCLAGVFQSVNFILQWMLLAIGARRASLTINGINAAANVVGFAVTVHWGITAVALSFVVRAYVLMPLTVRATRRAAGVGWREVLTPLLPAVAAALPALAAAAAWKFVAADIRPGLRLVSAIVGASALYLGLLRVLSPAAWSQLSGYLRLALHRSR